MIQGIGHEYFAAQNITEGVGSFLLLIFLSSCTWFQEAADIFWSLKKDFISLAFIGKRPRRYI